MDKFEAGQIVKNTLQNSFDKDRFIYFIKNLLNVIDESKSFQAHGYVKEKFKKTTEIIKTYERLGTYTDSEGNKIDILIVYLEKENCLDRARTTLRNFVADYLKQRDMKEAALVAFVSPNLIEWRFSLVKVEYKILQTPAGNIKAKEEFTPAKRFSFLVGPEEHTHTAQSRLVPIIQDDVNNPTLKQIEEAFSVERVTKEFYEKYRDLFLRLKESMDELINKDEKIKSNFQTNSVNSVDFIKKLLGQIVFLYFLQKKGWFGVDRDKDWGTGSKQFLRDLFDGKVIPYINFFNDILEPLFYDVLARDRSDVDHFNPLFKCKIPFLNGGLFDPLGNYDWIQTDILLNNDLFSNQNHTKDGDVGDGILDIFDRYNFTVKEDEPLEKEVAIDPEMLGKVFENLLEVKDRKSKGTYYTPREIVHYMCQESLINYLLNEVGEKANKTDIETLVRLGELALEHDGRVEQEGEETEAYSYKIPESVRTNAQFLDNKLKDIRVCDPAIGSGAFPVGMMNEIVRTRNTLTNYLKDKNNRSVYIFKREAIENSLYGVDIDSGAVEIAKLRLWLSLIVDEEDPKQIKPLPNLDYKIMQGNSLIEFVSQESISRSNDHVRNEFIDRFNQDKHEYQVTYDPGKKKTKREEINRLIEEIIVYDKKKQIENDKTWKKYLEHKQQEALFQEDNKQLAMGLSVGENTKLKTVIDQFDKLKLATPADHFEWHINFNEVFDEKTGFDVIIANPPYVGEKGHKEIFREIKGSNLEKFYQGKMDLFYFFFHLALNLGKQNSTISFISTNYYPTATGARKLRQDFKERAVIRNLNNFNELKIFESALGQHNMITVLEKTRNENAIAQTFITKRQNTATPEILHRILIGEDTETSYYNIFQKDLYDGEECYIRLEGKTLLSRDPIQKILENISKEGNILGTLCNVNQGVVTGADKVSQKHVEKYRVNAQVGDGIFVLNDEKIEDLHLTEDEKQILKPWFKNSDVNKWRTNTQSQEKLIFADKRLQNLNGNKLQNYLEKFKEILDNSTDNSPYLHRPRDISFGGPKIVVPQRSPTNTFGYNEIPWYASADVYFITQRDRSVSLKYVLASLNSKLYYLWLYHRGKRKGEMLELYQQPLSEIPIKKISEDGQKPFIEIVDKILDCTKSEDYLQDPSKQVKVKEYEGQVDQMVYKLYGLNEEEIKIVEHDK